MLPQNAPSSVVNTSQVDKSASDERKAANVNFGGLAMTDQNDALTDKAFDDLMPEMQQVSAEMKASLGMCDDIGCTMRLGCEMCRHYANLMKRRDAIFAKLKAIFT